MLVKEIIERIRNDLGDNRTAEYSGINLLASIRAELNDCADVTAASGENIASVVRAKLGDVPDSVLGTTTEANVDADSVIHYAQWGTTGNVTGTTGNINEIVELASGNGSLADYAADGIKTIKGMRPDATINGVLSGGFQTALNLYVLARCVEGEVETGTNAYAVFYDRFATAVQAVPAHIPDAELEKIISLGITTIRGRRPDLGLCVSTVPVLETYAMAQASQSKLGSTGNLEVNFSSFNAELDKIPYHYTDEELNQYITDGQNAIKAIRPDADEIMDDFSDAVKSYAVCHALGRRFGKSAEAMSLWQANDANYKNTMHAVPYHWTDEELLILVHDSIRDILKKRSDARMDDWGYELAGIETEPLIGDKYPLRESFAKASEWFSAAGAISCRIGADSGADAKYQMWTKQYDIQIKGER
ncbi:MAG: hypothetical protein J5858_15215 [Lentisphaeria bacterium]|nr:hypothetical protein [Lentisphaeria bacterium]